MSCFTAFTHSKYRLSMAFYNTKNKQTKKKWIASTLSPDQYPCLSQCISITALSLPQSQRPHTILVTIIVIFSSEFIVPPQQSGRDRPPHHSLPLLFLCLKVFPAPPARVLLRRPMECPYSDFMVWSLSCSVAQGSLLAFVYFV